jgi:hypothetical protein
MSWGTVRSLALLGALSILMLLTAPLVAQVTTLDSAGDVGASAAVAIGSDGLGLISYTDATNQSLKVAHCSNAACTAATITTLDTGLLNTATAVTVGGDGLGLILYEVGGFPPAGSMNVAHCSDLACTSADIRVVGGGYGGGEIVTGSDGLGLMSFVIAVSPAGDASQIRHCLDPLCSATNGSPLLPGSSRALAMGADGLGLFVYTVRAAFPSPSRVEAFHCADASCSTGTTSVLDVGPAVGIQDSTGDLAVGGDGLGLFMLSRFDGTWMAHCTDAICSSITKTPVVPGDSLAIGSDGLGLMSHSGSTLRIGHCEDADCAAQTFSTPIDVGAAESVLREGPDGLALIAYQGGSADLKVAHCSMTSCLVPGPKLLVSDAATMEGDAGTSGVGILVTLSEASSAPVSVDWQTDTGGGATATAGVDFLSANGTLAFAPGELSHVVTVSVVGDTAVEPDEFFFVLLSNASGAPIQDDSGRVTIVDDDAPSLSFDELVHGSDQRQDLQALPGPLADRDYYRLAQLPHSSWEVVVDGASGDVPPLILERLAADNVTVLQTGTSATGGSSVSLRWSNDTAFPVVNQHLSVRSGGCGPACDASAVYRIRAYETTARVARFNNSATQVTVLLLENTGRSPAQGTLWFWDGSGALVGSQAFNLGPQESMALNTASVAGTSGGSITLTSDGPYGALAGKAVAVEPATGFTFDTPLTFRPR